ncbi:hypothetical protein [Candidatus Accumulibacter sp. ACC003]|uniref:hypothetical protein n=1 Tax=Candidatus Accumulibacter sp. ACC003 TaxID=2823334 RepID=UPI0025B8ADCC|nr:hypothetical protein [Candidatus Accumulibacter sp. ACC003]
MRASCTAAGQDREGRVEALRDHFFGVGNDAIPVLSMAPRSDGNLVAKQAGRFCQPPSGDRSGCVGVSLYTVPSPAATDKRDSRVANDGVDARQRRLRGRLVNPATPARSNSHKPVST